MNHFPSNVLIVHAHPEPQSFCTALKSVCVKTFLEMGCDVEVSDLYALGFNPVASSDDFQERKRDDYLVYALEQRHGIDTGTIAADIKNEIEKIRRADLLILSFPIYWFSVPAILKGWIDRVFVSGYFYGGKRFYDQGGMVGKAAWVVTTVGGRQHMLCAGGVHGPIVDMLRPLLQGTLGYCGFEVINPFIGFHVPYLSDEQRGTVIRNFEHEVRAITSRQALRMPSLADYDSNMYPYEVKPNVAR